MQPIAIDDAVRMLPLLRSITIDIINYFSKFEVLQKDGIEKNKEAMNELIAKINSCLKEVDALGCVVQELRRGVVAIPSLYRGREVFLCVIPTTDETVGYFHDIDETYQDRQKIQNRHCFLTRGL